MVKKIAFPAIALSVLLFTTSQEAAGQYTSAVAIQLAPPQLKADSLFFIESAHLSLALDFPGVELRYTMDGSPVDLGSALYTKPLELHSSAEICVGAFHPEFQPSEAVCLQFFKVRAISRNAKASIHPAPNPSYAARGPSSLTDLQKGSVNFRNGASWLGFQADTVTLRLAFEEEQPVESVLLSTLEDHNAWIFLPQQIEVLSGGEVVGSKMFAVPAGQQPAALRFLEVPVLPGNYEALAVRVVGLPGIPEWHMGKGTVPWLFLDEVVVR